MAFSDTSGSSLLDIRQLKDEGGGGKVSIRCFYQMLDDFDARTARRYDVLRVSVCWSLAWMDNVGGRYPCGCDCVYRDGTYNPVFFSFFFLINQVVNQHLKRESSPLSIVLVSLYHGSTV